MIINTHGIHSWNELLISLNISNKMLNNNDLIPLKKWCHKYIKKHFFARTVEDIKELVQNYFQLNSKVNPIVILDNSTGLNIIQKAAQLGFDCFIEQLLCLYSNKKRKEILDSATKVGNTALHYAALNGNFDSIQILLENGANPNLVNSANKLPIHLAAIAQYKTIKGIKKCLKLLLIETEKSRLSLKDNVGMSFLLSLTQFDDVALIVDVLNRNKDLLTITDDLKQNPLHHAIINNSEQLVNYFLNYDFLVKQRTLNCSTALHLACRYANDNIIHTLLNHPQFKQKEFLNSLDEHGNTAMSYIKKAA